MTDKAWKYPWSRRLAKIISDALDAKNDPDADISAGREKIRIALDVAEDDYSLLETRCMKKQKSECKEVSRINWNKKYCFECGYFTIRKNKKGFVTEHGCKLQIGILSAKDDLACPDFVPREIE